MTKSKSSLLCHIGLCVSATLVAIGQQELFSQENVKLIVKSENFDRDPGWTGARNRVKPPHKKVKRQDFGYRSSNDAGASPGEIGGVIWRNLDPAWYGKKIKPRTMDDSLSCSGSLSLVKTPDAIMGYQTGSTVYVGFFSPTDLAWRPINFVGFRLEGYNEPDGATIEVTYGTSKWTAGGAFVNTSGEAQERLVKDLDNSQIRRVAPDGAKHTWEIKYDPDDADGSGQITFVFDGTPTTLNISPDHREQNAVFDHCGIFAAQLPGRDMTVYFDDMTVNGESEDFSSDPNWDGEGNRATTEEAIGYGENNFGYHRLTAGTESGGEIGGRFWRAPEPEHQGHYGGDVGRLTLDHKLFASGKLRSPRFSIDSGMHFGWYNSREQGWPPKNFVGVYLDSYSPLGRICTPMYGTSQASLKVSPEGRKMLLSAAHGPTEPLFYPDGRIYEWTLEYEPEANQGAGAVTFTLDGESETLNLSLDHRREGATFDRFGMFNMQDNNGKDCLVYLDDLTYTAAEPSK
jgi:hypothetical protein